MLWDIHAYRQCLLQWSSSVPSHAVAAFSSAHDKSSPEVAHIRLQGLHTRCPQRYRRNIGQYHRTIASQAVECDWNIIWGTHCDLYFRCLQRGDDIMSCAWCSLDDQHVGRSLDIDIRGGLVIGQDSILRCFQSDPEGMKTRRRSQQPEVNFLRANREACWQLEQKRLIEIQP